MDAIRWRRCRISSTSVSVPENALNIAELCGATAATGHFGISYGLIDLKDASRLTG